MHKVLLNLQALVLACFILFPVQAYAESNTFTVLPGDLLQISVWKEEGMDREVQVLPDGTISFPLVGTITVENKTLAEVRDLIKQKLRSSIPAASVSVSVLAPMGHKVSVLGEVTTPQEIVLNTRTGVMQAISQAGGLTPFAEEDEIVVIRTAENGEKQIIKFPFEAISRGKSLDKDIDLKPGDVVMVPTAGLF